MPMTNEEREGQATFDSNTEYDLQRALHQAKLSRDRWKFWSGNVPENINRTIEELEGNLLMTKYQLVEEEETVIIERTPSPVPVPKPIISDAIHGPQIDRYVEETMKIVRTPTKKNKTWKSFLCCHR